MKWQSYVIPVTLVVMGLLLLISGIEKLQGFAIAEIFLGCALALISYLLFKLKEGLPTFKKFNKTSPKINSRIQN